jgi:hypothetical protein
MILHLNRTSWWKYNFKQSGCAHHTILLKTLRLLVAMQCPTGSREDADPTKPISIHQPQVEMWPVRWTKALQMLHYSFCSLLCRLWLHLFFLLLNANRVYHHNQVTYIWLLLGISEYGDTSGRIVFFLKSCSFEIITSAVEVTLFLNDPLTVSRISLFIFLKLWISFNSKAVQTSEAKI